MEHLNWDQPNWPPVYPQGANNIERRVRDLEKDQGILRTHLGYMNSRILQLQAENSELRTEIQDAAKRGAWWIISTLVTVIMGLGLVVLRLRFPELVP